MIDFAAPGLNQRVSFELLDRKRVLKGALRGVRSMRRERNIYASPRTSAALELTLRDPIDFLRASVRIWAEVSDGAETERHALFTGIPMVTGEGRTETGTPVSLKLLDYSTLLDVPLGKNFAMASGTVATTVVRQLCESVGAWDAAITESSAALSTDMFLDATTSKRQAVNLLLKSIGYTAVWADEWGKLRCEPYVDGASRPVHELGFVHGRTCTYRPEFTIDYDLSDVPNHAVITVATEEPLEPVSCEAWLPAEHPLSYESRELEIPYTETDVDVSVAALPEGATAAQIDAYLAALKTAGDAYAERLLEDRATPTRSYTVSNRWRPFALQEVARFYAPPRGASPEIDVRVSIAKDTLQYTAGGVLAASTVLQEVNA